MALCVNVFYKVIIDVIICFARLFQRFSVNLYKEYSYLKLRDLEELPCFGVMIWQLCHLLRSAMNCIQITLYNAKVK